MTIGSEWLSSSYQTSAQSARKRAGAVALIVALVFGIGLVVGIRVDGAGDSGGDPSISTPTTGQPDPGPTGVLNGVPVGYAQTEAGALAAAEHFQEIGSSSLAADESVYVEAMSTMAAPEWRERAEETGRNGVAFFEERYGVEGSLLTSPVGARLVEFSPSTAVVELWSVSLSSGSNVPAGEQVWSLTTLSLRWVEGDWRISDQETSSSPPPPLVNGQQPESARRLVDEFSRG